MGRRTLVCNLLGIGVGSALNSASAAAPRDISPPMVRVAPPLRARINIFETMTPEQANQVRAGTSLDDTPAFLAALHASSELVLPEGTFRIANLALVGKCTIRGAGPRTILKLAGGVRADRLLSAARAAEITVADLTLDGAGVASFAATFTDVQRLTLTRLAVRGVKGYGLLLDGCSDARISEITLQDMGALGGYAALGLVGWTKRGARNKVSGVNGNRVTGRLIALFHQDDCRVEKVMHTNVIRGEAVFFEDCVQCRMDQITQIGGGSGRTSLPNPGNDGCAISGGCSYCSATNGLTVGNSGHSISISGTKDKAGPSYNLIANWTARSPDEGGVVITDQGVKGSSPSHNIVRDCRVENAGERVPEAGFSCFGASDNHFINCNAGDNRPVKRMTYGFEEGFGANDAHRNRWSGRVSAGETTRAAFVLVSSGSVAVNR
ncbi:MAG: hypothetical protein EON59_00835 [Alphaproteobacteria bacterium]|nr:MAG: hypothetical protein EON59_00835 [Alphaproteobacteria bacterium]